jgi:hypothetical protein
MATGAVRRYRHFESGPTRWKNAIPVVLQIIAAPVVEACAPPADPAAPVRSRPPRRRIEASPAKQLDQQARSRDPDAIRQPYREGRFKSSFGAMNSRFLWVVELDGRGRQAT